MTNGEKVQSPNLQEPDTTRHSEDHDRDSVIRATRRMLLKTGVVAGGLSLPSLSVSAQEQPERSGEMREGSSVVPEAFGDDLVDAVSTEEFSNTVVSAQFSGVTEQAQIYSQNLHGFPTGGDEFVVLSSGDATNIVGDPSTFLNTGWQNGQSETDYSPDGYDAFNIADIELEFEVPEGAQGFAFDFKFASEEIPGYLGSEFQDFFEVQLFEPNNTVQNIGLVDGLPTTVDNANEVANTPTGGSISPSPPFPSSPDTKFNSVTELQTITRDVSNYEGETIGLVFRVADAGDAAYDSAAFIGNLRFVGDVDTDPTPLRDALDRHEKAYKELFRKQFKSRAHYEAKLFDELGTEYANKLTNYWGYKSGELTKDDVNRRIRETADGSISEVNENLSFDITGEFAQSRYEFYSDLFSVLSQQDSLDQLKQVAYQYYLGTHPNQEAYIKYGGQTADEIFSEDWNYSTDVFDEITGQNDLSQGAIQQLISEINNVNKQLNSRGEEFVRNKEKQAEALIGFGEKSATEIHAQKYRQSVETDSVESNAVVTVTVLAIAAKAALAVGAGYTAAKCAGTFAAAEEDEGVELTGFTTDATVAGQAVEDSIHTGALYAQLYDLPPSATGDDTSDVETEYAAALKSGVKSGGEDALVELAEAVLESQAIGEIDAEIEQVITDNVSETEKLGLLGSFVDSIKSFFDDLLGDWYSYDAPEVGVATGEVVIRNPIESDGAFEPTLEAHTKLFDGNSPVGSGYSVNVSGDNSPLSPGETRSFDIDYKAPLDTGQLSGNLSVELGYSPVINIPTKTDLLPVGVCELDYVLTGDSETASFKVNDNVEVNELTNDSASEGETNSYTYTPAKGTTQALLDLSYKDHYSDLHLFDEQGNEVGYDYDTNGVVNEINGAEYSGRDTGEENREWITFPPVDGMTYTIEIVTPDVGTVSQGKPVESQATSLVSQYNVDSTEVPVLPPKLSVTPSTLSATSDVGRGDSPTISVVLEEVNGDQPAENVSLTPGDIIHEDDKFTISADNLSFTDSGFTVSNTAVVDANLTVPGGAAEGSYSGSIQVSSDNAETVTVGVNIAVDVTPADFTNSQNVVGTDGLQTAISEWRGGLITTDTVREVITAWRTGETVE